HIDHDQGGTDAAEFGCASQPPVESHPRPRLGVGRTHRRSAIDTGYRPPAGSSATPPKSRGRVAPCALRNSARLTANCPWISSSPLVALVTPIAVQGRPCSSQSAVNAFSCPRGTLTRARPVDSLNRYTNGSEPVLNSGGRTIRAPTP